LTARDTFPSGGTGRATARGVEVRAHGHPLAERGRDRRSRVGAAVAGRGRGGAPDGQERDRPRRADAHISTQSGTARAPTRASATRSSRMHCAWTRATTTAWAPAS
jgi:hypothetical protein